MTERSPSFRRRPAARALRFEGLEERSLLAGLLQFSASSFSEQEHSSGLITATLTFTASTNGGGFVTFFNVTSGTANSGADFLPGSILASFPSYSTGDVLFQTVSVQLIDDDLVEGDEQFQLAISSTTDASVTIDPVLGETSMVITDNDFAEVTFDPAAATFDESAGTQTLGLQLTINAQINSSPVTGFLAENLVLLFTSTGDGVDFNLPSSVMFPLGSGDSTLPFNIQLIDDNIAEGTESHLIALTEQVDNQAITTPGILDLTIQDDDFTPVITSSFPDTTVNEDAADTIIDLTPFFDDQDDTVAGLTFSVENNTNTTLTTATISGTNLRLAYNPDQNSLALVTVRATDSGGNFVDNPLRVIVNPVNDAPSFALTGNLTATSATSQTIGNFASSISAGPTDEASQSLAFSILTDNDAAFSVLPQIDSSTGTLQFTPASNTTATVTVSVVLSDNGGTANGGADTSAIQTFTINVNTNRPPVGAIRGSSLGVSGEPLRFRLVARDFIDTAQGRNFTFVVNWRDGNIETFVGPSGMIVTHAFPTPRKYLVTMTATDQTGATSATASREVTIRNAVLSSDMTFKVGGTPGDDMIVFRPINMDGAVRTFLNGRSLGTAQLCDIVVYAQAGNDMIATQMKQFGYTTLRLNVPLRVFGGTGNDMIDGSGNVQRNVFLGQAGDDILVGGFAADRLVGGTGNNTIINQGIQSLRQTTHAQTSHSSPSHARQVDQLFNDPDELLLAAAVEPLKRRGKR